MTQLNERCRYCLHLRSRHKFAKMFEHYQSFKFLAKSSAEGQTPIRNFNGYCEEPLCDCIQFIPGGSDEEYKNRSIRESRELEGRQYTIATDFETLRASGKMLRRDNSPMPKKSKPHRRKAQSIQRLLS